MGKRPVTAQEPSGPRDMAHAVARRGIGQWLHWPMPDGTRIGTMPASHHPDPP